MKKFWVEGWAHHEDERWYPRQIGFYFCAKNRKKAIKIIKKKIDWIWYRAEELPDDYPICDLEKNGY